MKNKKIFIIIAIILIATIAIFLIFNNKSVKKSKIGNNSSSQEIVKYMLNISSYTATVEVEIHSNKNQNKYKLKQEYNGPSNSSQEVLEPSNIAGVKIIKDGTNLRLENSNLNLVSIFEKYEFLGDNCLDLNCFIENYKTDENATFKEENNQIIMETSIGEKENKKIKTLYIEKQTAKPIKMEVNYTNKNMAVYILYSEVTVNS